MTDDAKTDTSKVRALNDDFRRTVAADAVQIEGGLAKWAAEQRAVVIAAVPRLQCVYARPRSLGRARGRHRRGSTETGTEPLRVFFKIDCLCPTCLMPTDENDPAKVIRQLTLILADEQ